MNSKKSICVKKTERLQGRIEIQGSKNNVLPIMAATLLTSGVSVINNCPMIEDVFIMCRLLTCLHVRIERSGHTLVIDTTEASYEPLPYSLTCRLRASILLLGPMLARWQKAEIGMPGGCAIGARPIDIHLDGFMRMNVDVSSHEEILTCQSYYLQGCEYHLRFPSVGATENMLLAAVVAKGRTILRGVAREPEVIELCNYLISMGALIEGIGTDVLIIKGTGELTSAEYENVYDRIVAGTYLLMAVAIPCDLWLDGIDDTRYLENVIQIADTLGAQTEWSGGSLRVKSSGSVRAGDYKTGIYPAFPTDLLPVLLTVLLKAEGDSTLTETIFENRFHIVRELEQLNALITVREQTAYIMGRSNLKGNPVIATDLRQGAALVIAGMMSKGCTLVREIGYIQRGYEDIVRDLQGVGTDICYI